MWNYTLYLVPCFTVYDLVHLKTNFFQNIVLRFMNHKLLILRISDVILHVLLILRISILCVCWLSIPIYLISWSTTSSSVDFHFFLQISFILTSENITKLPLNHDQLLYNSSIMTQMSDKMTEKQTDNNLRWHVIISLDLNCLLSSSNEIAQIINLHKFYKEHTFQKRFLRSSSIRFPWLTNLYTSMQGGYS